MAAPLSWTAGTTLTLNAANDITVNAPISFGGAAGAGLSLNATHALAINSAITIRGIGALAYDASSADNLSFGLTGSGCTAGIAYLSSTGSALTADAGGTLSVNGSAYTLVYTMAQLDGIDGVAASTTAVSQYGLSGKYALAGNIDATGTTYTGALIGYGSTIFSGALERLGHTISSKTIEAPGTDNIGLVGKSSGTLRDIGLVGGGVTGQLYTGALLGYNQSGTIAQA
ncbi:hypothetical protein WH91_17600 [Devosia psychrophila]|uniref:MBG domain-containing protein n=1 Tax=Devosia psychrophila TaxID=728005 RepID=A0ABR5DV09_9HYPH|nr:hypothetical protein WH91_17600 [Devosia psychrophila]